MLKNANGKVSDFVSDHSKCGKLFSIEADNLDMDKTGNYLPLLPTCMGSGPGLRYQKPCSAGYYNVQRGVPLKTNVSLVFKNKTKQLSRHDS